MQFGLFGGARTKRSAGIEDSQGYESFIEYVIEADRLGFKQLFMKKAGVHFDTANQMFIEEVQTKAQPIVQNWINEVKEKRNMDGAMLLREFHDEVKRVAAGD